MRSVLHTQKIPQYYFLEFMGPSNYKFLGAYVLLVRVIPVLVSVMGLVFFTTQDVG